MNILAPSILAADFKNLQEQIDETRRGGAQYVHFDVMDGSFVEQISFGQPVLETLRPGTDLFLDIHLMVLHPETQIDSFAKCGADGITFHLEATDDPQKLLDRIHAHGIRTGLSIKPDTPVEAAFPYLPSVDMLLIMTVEPGKGGQAYIPASTERIHTARQYIEEHGLQCDIEVDGGIRVDNVRVPLDAGANVIVAGSAVYRGNIYENTKALLAQMQ